MQEEYLNTLSLVVIKTMSDTLFITILFALWGVFCFYFGYRFPKPAYVTHKPKRAASSGE